MTTSDVAVAPLTLSFMTANFVATELGYGSGDDWGPYDEATNRAFAPLESFADRFDALTSKVAGAGFGALDLWTAHLNWRWATRAHIDAALDSLHRHDLTLVSLAGDFGATADELGAACRLANALDVDLLGGMGGVLRDDRAAAEAVLRHHGVRFGYENHPERVPGEVLELIGDADDVLGATVDTGWWATNGYTPRLALEALQGRLFHVHLKDVERPGEHVTCSHGEGCADIAGCVDWILASDYAGAISVEHEPYDRDPTDECVGMHEALQKRIGRARGGDDA